MTTDLNEIKAKLIQALEKHSRVLKVTSNSADKFEVHGTIRAPQGKQMVDGIYFASILLKAKDVRFYFFPIYTHKNAIDPLVSADVRKFLKGKSCFHVKKLDEEMLGSIGNMIDEGIKRFQADGLLAS